MKHTYKNFNLEIPDHWVFEEDSQIESCYNKDSESTLRIHLINLLIPLNTTVKENVQFLTGGNEYEVTKNDYLLCKPKIDSIKENAHDLTIYTWKVIKSDIRIREAIIAVLTYTFHTKDLDSEKEIIAYLENSFQNSFFN